ncbi:MAG: cytidylate kinase [candidate division Zixibacteria bacterium RBG_16_50_21]|nr:MAG: cytidylate kinase [candidate division Zixibacteria bacterium RBG_16_50_21]
MKNRKNTVIAIDGPAGSGKSTTARLVARKLGFLYLDTGAMYRALTYGVLKEKKDPSSPAAVESVLKGSALRAETSPGRCRIFLGKQEVSNKLRSRSIETNVSMVSRHQKVRRLMVELQRRESQKGNLVIEGRDTATIVFPRADLKIFLQASLTERAKRRAKKSLRLQLEEKELLRRDRLDSTRPVAPLKRARDSYLIDTTGLTIPQQVRMVLQLFEKKIDV